MLRRGSSYPVSVAPNPLLIKHWKQSNIQFCTSALDEPPPMVACRRRPPSHGRHANSTSARTAAALLSGNCLSAASSRSQKRECSAFHSRGVDDITTGRQYMASEISVSSLSLPAGYLQRGKQRNERSELVAAPTPHRREREREQEQEQERERENKQRQSACRGAVSKREHKWSEQKNVQKESTPAYISSLTKNARPPEVHVCHTNRRGLECAIGANDISTCQSKFRPTHTYAQTTDLQKGHGSIPLTW